MWRFGGTRDGLQQGITYDARSMKGGIEALRHHVRHGPAQAESFCQSTTIGRCPVVR